MAANDGYRRYVEAAAALGQITRARAEEIMREIMSGGDVSRAQAQEWVDDMVERSRKATESIVDMIRSEVASQLSALGVDPEDLARQAADILRRSAEAGRRVMQDVAKSRGTGRPGGGGSSAASKGAAGKKTAGKKTAGKKTAGKKTAGKKTAATTKAAATKSAAKKAPAKKAPAKKAAPKKASARAAAKKQGSGTTP